MSRRSANTAEQLPPVATTVVDRVCFFAIVSLLACRLLVSESYERVQSGFLASAAVAGPTPATTAWLDWLTLLVSVVALAVRPPLIERGYSWTVGIGLLLVAIASSTALAAEKQVAALAGANMFVLILAGVALTGVSREAWMRRLIIATVLACSAANAVKCFQQVGYEFDDTAQFWREVQRPQLQQRGVDLTDPMIVDYERRLASQNAFGMLAHPNVAASIMAAGAVLAFGACAAPFLRRSARAERSPTGLSSVAIVGGILALAAIAGCFTTGSNGALLAAIIACGFLIVSTLAVARPFLRSSVVIGGYCGGLLLLFGFGLARGTLPGASLSFRWEYWTAGLRGWLDAPLIGIGRMNFVTAYLQYRAETATEEVKDPHNLWITLLVELGPIGLLAGVLLLAALVRSMLAGTGSPAQSPKPITPRWAIVGMALGVVGLQAVASGYPLQDANVALLWVFEFAAVWVVLLLLGLVAVDSLASDSRNMRLACLAALACLLVHNWVDFSLAAVPGMAMAVLIATAALAPRVAQFDAPVPRVALSWSLAGVALLALHTWAVAMPMRAIDQAYRVLASIQRPLTAESARPLHALATNAWDSDMPGSIAALLMAHARLSDPPSARLLEEARVFAQRSVEINARSAANWALLARVLDAQVAVADASSVTTLARRATEAWQQAIERYPSNPRAHLSAAAAHATLLRLDRAATDAAIVRFHIEAARRIDNARDPRVAARLRPEELSQLAALETQISASQPSPE